MVEGSRPDADDVLVIALACGAALDAAAAKAGVSPKSVQRRMLEAPIRAKLAKARSDMIERATAMLSAASMEAVKTLLDLQHKKSPPTARLGAARSVLKIGSRLRTEHELISRLEAAERGLGLRANGS